MRSWKNLALAAALLAGTTGCSGGKGGDAVDRGVTISPISGATTEGGGQATFTIVLDAKPAAEVTFALASSDPTEGTVTPASLTFTADNFAAPQIVTVTGAADDEADGAVTWRVTFAKTTEDAKYAAIAVADVPVVNIDDDTASVLVSPLSGPTSEGGLQASFTIVLGSRPSADVGINFDSSDPDEGSVAVQGVTFTTDNWNAPQTIQLTGVDDAILDGTRSYSIDFDAPSSSDADYAALAIPSLPAVNVDDDTAGITVTPVSAATTELGGTATFSIVLNSEPTADVTVNFASSDATEGSLSVTSRTFTSANFSAPQVVTVTGLNDALDDGNQVFAIAFGATDSADAAYAAITPASLPVTNTDDDTAGIIVSAASGATSEAGGAATFNIVLASQPTASVTVNFNTNDGTEGTPNVTSRTFSTANFSTPQSVTVTGLDDNLADGTQPYAITFSATASGDAQYAAITPGNVLLSNVDNDSAGILVGAISGPTSEAGGSATFSIVLASQPSASVVVNFISNDLTEGVTSVGSRTFTTANYSTPQLVTVTGVDDAVIDGNQPYAITFGSTSSSDAAYAAITPANVLVTNLDNDPTRALIVYSAPASHGADVQSKLQGTNAFLSVDLFDASAGTPTFSQLGGYDAVLVFAQTPYLDATTLGNVLADYHDAGGRVVVAANVTGAELAGDFGTVGNGYLLLAPAAVATSSNSLGMVAEPSSPLMTGVSTLTASTARRSTGALVNGGVAVASWSGGAPLVVRGTVGGRPRADLNFYPPSSDADAGFWMGDGAQLLENAMLSDAAAAPSRFVFSGVLNNVAQSTLTGWTQCHLDTYATTGTPLSTILGACNKANLLLACRTTGSTTLITAANAPRADVIFDTGTSQTPHNANGVGWYFSTSYSWGYAGMGDTLTRSSCDTNTTNGNNRLCFHTGSGQINGGWRCGVTTGLNSSTAYQRVIYHAD